MLANANLFSPSRPTPSILVKGTLGKSDVVHMLETVARWGGLPKNTRFTEAHPSGGGNHGDKTASLTVDVDGEGYNAVCFVEQVIQHFSCSCFIVNIGDYRMMVKVAMPGQHAVKHALMVLLAVDALDGDLTKTALALANLRPRTGYGACSTIFKNNAHIHLMDFSKHASAVSTVAALEHLQLLDGHCTGRIILVLPKGEYLAAVDLGALMVAHKIDHILTLDSAVAERGRAARIGVDKFDRCAAFTERLAHLLMDGDRLLIVGRSDAGLGDVVAHLTREKRDFYYEHASVAAE